MYKIVLTLFSVFVLAQGCQAATEIKAGGEGEFCTGADVDCREGFVCVAGTCRGQGGGSGQYSCTTICNRLAECSTNEDSCVSSCEATFRGRCAGTPCPWSTQAIDSFGKCIVDDLTCEEARAADAPDTCFGRIPLDSNRENRCDAFVAAANRCGASNTQTLRNGCVLLAKTATEASWNRTDACVERIAAGDCGGTGTCFNSVFGLMPTIDLTGGPLNNQFNNAVEPN